MMYHLDQSVGSIVQALAEENLLKNSIIIFSTDNGGPAEGQKLFVNYVTLIILDP